MGEVYRAHDSRLDRTIALKILPQRLAGREDVRQRFQVEARAIAKLQHANICSVFDVGETDGVDYLVLEYLEGETLAKRLERGPLPVSEALQLGVQIAAGLDAAYRAGITHRDLKPAGKSVEIGIPHALFETKVTTLPIRNRYVAAADGQKFLVLVQEEQPITGFEIIMNWPGLLKER
jgi:hypothetical protein